MRCDKCGARMIEEHQNSFFRRPATVYTCTKCNETFKKIDEKMSFTAIILHDKYGNETMANRANPIDLH